MNFYKAKTKQPIWLTFHGDLKKLIRFELMRPASLLENKKKRKKGWKRGLMCDLACPSRHALSLIGGERVVPAVLSARW